MQGVQNLNNNLR